MGAKISGAGTDVLKIEGVKKLLDVEYTVIPDRIVASTYLIAGAITRGNIKITHIVPGHIRAVTSVLEETGCKIDIKEDSIYLEAKKDFCGVDLIRTQTYPGFPTDAQAPMLAYLTLAKGTSIIIENIFENRFKHVPELIKMGADIKFKSKNEIEISGGTILHGAKVISSDLRCGAALVIAGLAAEGITYVSDDHYIERGYSNLEEKLQSLGARINIAELCKVNI
jgi:UDP-N-acetylglucosamine 1-carboxyvinyltransferase